MAQTPTPTTSASRNTLRAVPTHLIDPGNNDRQAFDPEELQQLASSIDKNGLAQPPTVRPKADGRFELVAGERRFRACSELLGWDTISAFVRDMDDSTAGAIMLAENVARVDLNPVEEALAYKARQEAGHSVEDIADQAGVKPSRVQWRLDLLNLIPEALKLVRDGNLGVGAAWEMHGLDANRQHLAIRALAEGDLTGHQFTSVCRRLQGEQDQDSMFDAGDFMRVEEYVTTARANTLGKAGLTKLVARLTEALDEATERSSYEGITAHRELVAEATAALDALR